MSTTVRVILILSLAFSTFPTGAWAHELITRVSDQQNVSLSQMVAAAGSGDLVLIGESHDNKSHHEMQLAVIRSMWAKKLPLAIGLEMMQSDSQAQLDDWIEGRIDENAFRSVFATNWSGWEMYREIFIFARENHIPMVALNVPRDIVKKVAHYGFASLSADEKKGLPQGTTCDINNPHTAFLKKTFQEMFKHFEGDKTFTHFCEAQTLRNSGMALNIERYSSKHPGTKVVVLTGIWHAIKNAIPEHLGRNGSKLACTVILPEVPEISAGSVAKEADYLVDL